MKTRLSTVFKSAQPTCSPLLSFLAPSIRAQYPFHLIRRTLYRTPDYSGATQNDPEPAPSQTDHDASPPPPPLVRSSADLAEQISSRQGPRPSDQIRSGGLFNLGEQQQRARARLPKALYPLSAELTGNQTTSNRPNIRSRAPPGSMDSLELNLLNKFTDGSVAPKHAIPEPNLRLGPSLGRSVAIDPNRRMDLARAIKAMERQCRNNNVRQDEKAQLFHVRRGQRRKLLKSKRWRIRFKNSFQGAVQTVLKMKRQGW